MHLEDFQSKGQASYRIERHPFRATSALSLFIPRKPTNTNCRQARAFQRQADDFPDFSGGAPARVSSSARRGLMTRSPTRERAPLLRTSYFSALTLKQTDGSETNPDRQRNCGPAPAGITRMSRKSSSSLQPTQGVADAPVEAIVALMRRRYDEVKGAK